jgi:hypothetical protein
VLPPLLGTYHVNTKALPLALGALTGAAQATFDRPATTAVQRLPHKQGESRVQKARTHGIGQQSACPVVPGTRVLRANLCPFSR